MTQGLEVLVNHIIGDARKKAGEEEERGRMESELFAQSFRKETDEISRGILEEFTQKTAAECRRIVKQAETDAKLRLLQTKQDLIKAVFRLAAAKLLELPAEKKKGLYFNILLDSVKRGDEQVAASSAERKLWEEVLTEANKKLAKSGRPGKLSLASEPAGITGGFLLLGGDYEVDASLENLLKQAEERLGPEVARMLFEEAIALSP
ncbi:MAG: V-type ATP synthase subunit E [Bacillota bacterium]